MGKEIYNDELTLHDNKRLAYIDVAKGILIISVLINHIGNLASASGVVNETIATIPSFRFWCPFFMPAFFVIAGICSNYDVPLLEFIIKNFKSLIIPAFTLLFVRIAIRYLLDGQLSTLELSEFYSHHGIKVLLNVGYWNWFLVAMFTTKLMYWLLNRYVKRDNICFLICIICYLLGFILTNNQNESIFLYNVWFYQHALLFLIYIFVGRCIKRHKQLIEESTWLLLFSILYVLVYLTFVIAGWQIPKITSDIFLTKNNLFPH